MTFGQGPDCIPSAPFKQQYAGFCRDENETFSVPMKNARHVPGRLLANTTCEVFIYPFSVTDAC